MYDCINCMWGLAVCSVELCKNSYVLSWKWYWTDGDESLSDQLVDQSDCLSSWSGLALGSHHVKRK